MSTSQKIEVINTGTEFVARRDGLDLGFLQFHEGYGILETTHTVVDPAQRGQGIAVHLVEAAVAYAKAQDLAIKPTCWYVAKWVAANPDHGAKVVA